MMETGMLFRSNVAPVLACLVLNREESISLFFQTQMSEFIMFPNLQTAASSPSTLLGRKRNEKPIKRLLWSSLPASTIHVPVEFNWAHGEPIRSFLSFSSCSALSEPVWKLCASLREHERASRVTERREIKKERGLYNFYYKHSCFSLIPPSETFPDRLG